ncbi:hypothetical protein [Pseudoalteromonas aurantia]|uniref:Ribbon-helix-helix protein CopG domain-containing protein n=1 Tax=Pseudoalteromonas aurantia TaxID=43654 RepID=A0A5S3V2J4_9GAMM|nr:hypothetical protein [Pseudoalteromonas aurantia]TMO64844.1 hypothetical protein CWC19_18180 [Pseudoalteromonas aurantia]
MAKYNGRSYGVSFTEDIDSLIRAEVSRTGLSKTEVVRNAATESLTQPSIQHLIKQLELRMLQRNFEMNCIIVGLNEQQRQQAAQLCNQAFEQEVLA